VSRENRVVFRGRRVLTIWNRSTKIWLRRIRCATPRRCRPFWARRSRSLRLHRLEPGQSNSRFPRANSAYSVPIYNVGGICFIGFQTSTFWAGEQCERALLCKLGGEGTVSCTCRACCKCIDGQREFFAVGKEGLRCHTLFKILQSIPASCANYRCDRHPSNAQGPCCQPRNARGIKCKTRRPSKRPPSRMGMCPNRKAKPFMRVHP
jgi:hypothetical protein